MGDGRLSPAGSMHPDEVPRALLDEALARHRAEPYEKLVAGIGRPHVRSVRGSDGRDYDIEIEMMWNDQPGGLVRVLGAIDDGSERAFLPISDDFIMDQHGRVVGAV
ncbi:MAG TPA: hypothetical protein VI297_07980 [Gemmatimonadales bacterium]